MRYIADELEAKWMDQTTIRKMGIPSIILMERAALSVAEEVEAQIGSASNVLCICGCGNNGADGIAVARILKSRGISVAIYIPVMTKNPTEEWSLQKRIAENLEIPFINSLCVNEYTILIDAIFGVGLSREITGVYRECIQTMNESKLPIVAVDLPSGIHSTTGEVLGIAVHAQKTITFALEKRGTFLYPGKEYAGEVLVKDIGIPQEIFHEKTPKAFTYTETDILILPPRAAYANKGTFGKILLIAGSKNMSGAAFLSAKAAYKMGAGIVRIFTPEENREALQILIPEAVLVTYNKENWRVLLAESIEWADVIGIGPGLGRNRAAEALVDELLKAEAMLPEGRFVWDADALNILSERNEDYYFKHHNVIVTPHLGEMSRLMKMPIEKIKKDLISIAYSFSKQYNAVCILKDARTVVTGSREEVYLNSSGNSGMATAGSGDVLTGIVCGMLAMKIHIEQAAFIGVYLHGLAGDRARDRMGEYSLTATDLLDGLVDVLKSVRKQK